MRYTSPVAPAIPRIPNMPWPLGWATLPKNPLLTVFRRGFLKVESINDLLVINLENFNI
jgi:hypothetical protein